MKRSLYVDIHKSMLSLMYPSTSTAYPLSRLSSDLTWVRFGNVYKNLIYWLHAAKTSNFNMQPILGLTIVDTAKHINQVFSSDWKDNLFNDDQVRFRVPWDLAEVKKYSHVRLHGFGVTFVGAVPPADKIKTELLYYIEFGPQCIDKDMAGNPIQYWYPKTGFENKQGTVGGWRDPLQDIMRPTFFCRGEISIDVGSAKVGISHKSLRLRRCGNCMEFILKTPQEGL